MELSEWKSKPLPEIICSMLESFLVFVFFGARRFALVVGYCVAACVGVFFNYSPLLSTTKKNTKRKMVPFASSLTTKQHTHIQLTQRWCLSNCDVCLLVKHTCHNSLCNKLFSTQRMLNSVYHPIRSNTTYSITTILFYFRFVKIRNDSINTGTQHFLLDIKCNFV